MHLVKLSLIKYIMSLSKVYYDKKFSDLTIKLVDRFSEEILQVHKCILYSKNPYFGNMFGDNFQESNKSQVIIKVPNVFAAKIVIESLYDINHTIDLDWELQVDLYKCKDFFSLEKVFPKIKISAEEFDKFLDLIDTLGYPNDIIECIINNLPENYDLERFPTELLQSMYDLCDAYNFVNVSSRDIIISNLKTGEKIMKNELRGDYFLYYDYVPETDELIVLENNDKCLDPLIMYKINIKSREIYDIFPEKNYYIPHQVKYISDKKVLIHYDNKVKIFDVEEYTFTNFFPQKIEAESFSYCDYLCHKAVFYSNQIRVFDSAGNLVNKYEICRPQSLYVVSKENLVIIEYYDKINIWNYLTNEIKKIKVKSCSSQYKLSPNDKHLVVILGKKIVVYDILSLEKIKTLKFISKYLKVLSCDFKIGGELIVSCEKMLYFYDKDYNEIGSIENNKKIYELKLIPGKDFNLAKKIYHIIETRKLKN
ncbi:btb/poz domain-containing protein [Moumouvirus maliensis]|nr:btb/poz domain-containing protein [Moumouvirus maliensis]